MLILIMNSDFRNPTSMFQFLNYHIKYYLKFWFSLGPKQLKIKLKATIRTFSPHLFPVICSYDKVGSKQKTLKHQYLSHQLPLYLSANDLAPVSFRVLVHKIKVVYFMI